MDYLRPANRKQSTLFPEVLDDYIDANHPVRFIDAYIESLDLFELGFTHTQLATTGRPPYRAQELLKLYVYGYLHGLRSSRALEHETQRNVELMWLLGKLQPDFKTIANFRKDNTKPLQAVCTDFLVLCKRMGVFGGQLIAIDGSKFEAVNHSSRSYSQKGIELAIAELNEQLRRWLEHMNRADREEIAEQSGQSMSEKISALQAQKAELQALRDRMRDDELPGGSLTDPDSRTMRTGHKGRDVCYNVQIAVDSKHKLIVAHQVTSEHTDLHQLLPMTRQAKEMLGAESVEVVADKGYYNEQQIVACERLGASCFVPAAKGNGGQTTGIYSKKDFSYDPIHDSYCCPAGQRLPYKSTVIKNGKNTRIYETKVCKGCSLRKHCTSAKRGNRRIYRWKYESVIEAMKARLKAYPEKMALRAQLAEHPFGTLKRAMGHGYFLSKGLENVSTEMSLSVLTYNLKRMLTIVGSKNLIQALMMVGHVLYKNTVQHIPFPTINVQDYNLYPNTPFPTFYTG
jgi:transposase